MVLIGQSHPDSLFGKEEILEFFLAFLSQLIIISKKLVAHDVIKAKVADSEACGVEAVDLLVEGGEPSSWGRPEAMAAGVMAGLQAAQAALQGA